MNPSIQDRPVSIYLEANPNPNSLKFVVDYMLLEEGDSYDYPEAPGNEVSELATRLFEFDYVKRVFFMSNFVTVTKSEDVEWIEIREELKKEIKDYLESGKLIVAPKAMIQANTPREDETDLDVQIKAILDEYIRPAVEQDGGAITYHSFQDGVVKVLLQGSCSGCPSSTITLKAGIENLLKRMVPEVQSVEAEGI
ncbi:MAG: NifU family protein [Cyclobacteriaceae bacterium]|nr:NifU family protein [Cyclobacteriaceae bacterium]MCH8516498.1 NifU family protein [Cyclobacteriaceae bacterium]